MGLLGPTLRRPMNPQARPQLNRALRRALQWWCQVASSAGARCDQVCACPPPPSAVSYTDAGTIFSAILFPPVDGIALFFRTHVPAGDPINQLEAEAAARRGHRLRSDPSGL